jgi:hypothetical protein
MRLPGGAILYVLGSRQIKSAWDHDPSTLVVHDAEGNAAPSYTTPPYMRFRGSFGSSYETEWGLPEEQQVAVALALRAANRRGVPLRVVDLGRWWRWARRRTFRNRGWDAFPVLLGPDGQGLVGADAFTENAVNAALAPTYSSST